MDDYTIVLSGPLARMGPLMGALQRAGVDLSEPQPTNDGWHGLPTDPTQGWVRCRHADLNEVAEAAARADWTLRKHSHTPPCTVCAGQGQANLADQGLGTCLHCKGSGKTNKPVPQRDFVGEIDQLHKRLAALEAAS